MNIQTSSYTATTVTSQTPPSFPQGTHYAIFGVGANATVPTGTATRIPINVTGVFNGSNGDLKLPYKGIYTINLWISYATSGLTSNQLYVYMSDSGVAITPIAEIRTGPSSSITAIPFLYRTVVVSLVDNLVVRLNGIATLAETTGVNVQYGHVRLLQRFP